MAPDKEKLKEAFREMKKLGIGPDTVRPVLKNLLKLYDNNWALIEEDNFRTLADAIFEAHEDKAGQHSEMIEPPHKKPHILPEDQASSTMDNRNVIVNIEEEEKLPRNSSGTKRAQSFSGDNSNYVHHTQTRRKGKDPVGVFPPPADENAYAQPRPLAIVNHGPNGTDLGLKRQKKLNAIAPFGKSLGSGSSNNPQKNFQTTLDIASSICGQVKVSLTCHGDVGKLSFHHPNADEVVSYAERKYKKVHQNNGDRFSMEELLRELCESYLEIGSGSGERYSRHSSSRGEVISQKRPMNKKKAVHMDPDITKGTEKVEISLVGEIGNEDLPEFVYSPENIVFQAAYVHVSLARIPDEDCCLNCNGDCISASLPCACAKVTGGEFAYTHEGLLNESFLDSCIEMMLSPEEHLSKCSHSCPLERVINANRPQECKGHIYKKFIKECWRKCGCSMQCGNRVVQRGISRKLQVFLTSNGKGWGIRPLEELPKGAFVCEYAGEILTNNELYFRNMQNIGKGKHTYPVLLDADWATEDILKDEDALCLDATNFGNIARFINHRCHDGNLINIPVQVETPDRHYYHVAFFTKRKVDALEELTWDYGTNFDDHTHPIPAFKCRCGSNYCRSPAYD